MGVFLNGDRSSETAFNGVPGQSAKSLGRMVREITLASPAAAISVTTDANSLPFSLKSMEIDLIIPAVAGLANNAYVNSLFTINSLNSYIVNVTGSHIALAYGAIGIVRNLRTESNTKITVLGESFLANSQALGQGYGADGSTLVSSIALISSSPPYGASAIDSITSLSILLSSGNLPAGTIARIWGWDA